MKRRNFLAASTLSLGAVIQSKASAFFASSSGQDENFLSYISQTSAIPQNLVFLDDQKLEAVYSERSRGFTSLGYRNLNGKFYLLDGGSLALFPLALKNRESGIIDISAVFVRKNLSGNWQYCTTFSSFHFAAIKQAVAELVSDKSRKELARLITPVLPSLKSFTAGRVETVGGKMDLIVNVDSERTTLDFKLIKGETPLIARSFTNKKNSIAGIPA
jgi:hypothetical protein